MVIKIIHGQNIFLIELSLEDFGNELTNYAKLSKKYALKSEKTDLEKYVKDIFYEIYKNCISGKTDYRNVRRFIAVEYKSMEQVGGIDLKESSFLDSLDHNPHTELGYGMSKNYEGLGYATEMVGILCKYLKKESVNIYAETEKYNNASIRVLEKNNFSRIYSGETYWWKLTD